jgi:hypothetical protein
MAEKSVVFSLKVNTGNSVNDIQAMDKAVVNFNNDLKTTQATAAQGTGVKSFEDQLNTLDARLKAGGLSMRETTKLMKEYQTVALQAGSESPIGSRAVASASALSDKMTDLNNRVRLLSSDTIKLDTALAGLNTGAAVFQGMTSAIALTGIENEDLQKTMVKLQAVQGVTNAISIVTNNLNKDAILGIQVRNALEKASQFIKTGSIAPTLALAGAETAVAVGTTGATIAMKAFRIALLASGIGAIVLVLIAAADALGAFDDGTENAEASQKKLDEQIKKTNKSIEDQRTATDRLTEIIDRQTRIDLIRAKTRGANDAELTQIEEDGSRRRIKVLEQEFDAAGKFMIKTSKTFTDRKQIDAATKAFLEADKNLSNERLNLEEKVANRILENSRKKVESKKAENKELRKLATVDINQIIAEEEALDEQLRLLSMTADERALDAIQEKYFKLRTEAEIANAKQLEGIEKGSKAEEAILKKQGKSIADMNKAEEAEKKVITDKAAAEKLAADKLLADERVRLLDSYNGVILSKEQLQINKINDADRQKNTDLKKSLDLKLISQAEYDAAVILQAQTTADALAEIELDKRKAVIDTFQQSLELALSVSSALDTMREISNAKELEGIEKGSEAEEAILKKQFEKGKKAQIATAFLNALQAQISILGQYPKFDGGFAMVAAMAGAAITSAATIAKIKSTQFEGGGGGPGGPDPGLTANNFSVADTSSTSTQIDDQGNVMTNNTPSTQVFVLETDITAIQNNVMVQETKSTF